MASNIQKWMDRLTPEQLAEHKAKMARGRKRFHELKRAEQATPADPTPPPSPAPQPQVYSAIIPRPAAMSPEYAPLFRKLLGEYLDILACMTGGGTYTTDYCRLCVQTGVHGVGSPCGCPCHRTRTLLANFDDDRM